DAMATTHLAQQPGGHPRERHTKVGLRADLLNVGSRPAGLRGEHVELHEQHGLAHTAQAEVDLAALILTAGQALDQRLEVLEVAIATCERGRLATRAWSVGILPLVHACFLRISSEPILPPRNHSSPGLPGAPGLERPVSSVF